MTEQELRALVREALTRHATGAHGVSAPHRTGDVSPRTAPVGRAAPHASHGVFAVSDGAGDGGPCIIEPAVPCNHCGYCKSYGH